MQSSKLSLTHRTTRLLLIDLDDIVLFHLQSLGSFIVIYSPSVKQKPEIDFDHIYATIERYQNIPERSNRNSNPLRIRFLELPHLGGLLHTEVDLVGVLANHLQLDVLCLVAHLSRILGYHF